ncbi:hypothetical protein CAPTEDRAFT_198450 [Capitella teleta]|uniref:BAG family molecular chaperone regulator 1 n=1 Tax=Capitella teleta TaxID=283909 RepID=R7U442_CAPTE|nr:hypothetical protein CAPTEDRAFT_198450 [Capitella teleta]|eukprot:ELT97930.1 hypothetical protein CAPTEDRAFT_198450 [Capitella teleta]
MADDVGSSTVQLIHGGKKYSINLSALSGSIGDTLQVQHLAQEVERLTQVPVKGQKLIHKGKSLTDQTKEVSSLGLQNGSKIMVIGKRFDIEEDEMMMRMRVIEKDVNTQSNKLTQIRSQMQGISNGFLDADLQKQTLPKLEKQTALCIEDCSRLLELLDGLALGEAMEEVKTTRKKLVKQIQRIIDDADKSKEDLQKMAEPS